MRNGDEIRGKLDQAAGKAKEYVGQKSGDTVLEQDGSSQRAQGEAEEGFGKARRKVGEALSDLGKKLRR